MSSVAAGVQAVLFDMEGVLCDSEPMLAEAACRLFRRTALTVMKGMQMASKKTPHEFTSARVASKAGKLLSNPKTPANVKSVAAPR